MSTHADTKPWTVPALAQAKRDGNKLVMLTAYDNSFARVMDANGVDLVLVGDSLGMVVQGHDSTLPVTVEDIVYHTTVVARGLQRALLCQLGAYSLGLVNQSLHLRERIA